MIEPLISTAMFLVAGFMSIMLFYLGINRNSNKVLVWAVIFLGAAFGALEWAFWLNGYNMFQLFFGFLFPLVAWFLVWFAFIIWLFEEQERREIWLMFLALLVLIATIAMNCMNCFRFVI